MERMSAIVNRDHRLALAGDGHGCDLLHICAGVTDSLAYSLNTGPPVDFRIQLSVARLRNVNRVLDAFDRQTFSVGSEDPGLHGGGSSIDTQQ